MSGRGYNKTPHQHIIHVLLVIWYHYNCLYAKNLHSRCTCIIYVYPVNSKFETCSLTLTVMTTPDVLDTYGRRTFWTVDVAGHFGPWRTPDGLDSGRRRTFPTATHAVIVLLHKSSKNKTRFAAWCIASLYQFSGSQYSISSIPGY